ncbi:MAG TPA: hypothetical protein PK668_01900 [Myxococcota bacterium]|nr:hypothetical protein [Myxococcota bacterium]
MRAAGRSRLQAFGVCFLWAGLAWACSGPGAAEAIERATSLGWILFGAAALVAGLAMLGLRRLGWSFKRLRWAALPVALDPAWWWSARAGDCGRTLVLGAWIFLGLTVLLAAILLVVAFRGRKVAPSGPTH